MHKIICMTCATHRPSRQWRHICHMHAHTQMHMTVCTCTSHKNNKHAQNYRGRTRGVKTYGISEAQLPETLRIPRPQFAPHGATTTDAATMQLPKMPCACMRASPAPSKSKLAQLIRRIINAPHRQNAARDASFLGKVLFFCYSREAAPLANVASNTGDGNGLARRLTR